MSASPLITALSMLSPVVAPFKLEPGEQVVLDPNAALFEEHVKKHTRSTLLKIDCPGNFVPLFQSFTDDVLNLSNQMDVDFFKAVLKKESATRSDFVSEFLLCWAEFKKSKDPKRVVALISHCLPELKKESRNSTWVVHLESFLTLINTGRADLFEKPASAFLNPNHAATPRLKYRIAMYSFVSLIKAANKMQLAFQDRLNAFNRQILSKQVRQTRNALQIAYMMAQFDDMQMLENLLAQIASINEKLLKKNTVLSPEHKTDISIAFQRLTNQFLYSFKAFSFSFDPVDGGDLTLLFRKVITSDEAEKIAMVFSKKDDSGRLKEVNIDDLEVFDEGYVEKNRSVFEEFLPRLRELQTVFAELHAEMIPLCRLIKDFPLYLQFGDHAKLGKRCQSEGKEDFTIILSEEIGEFGTRLKNDRTLIVAAAQFLSDEANDQVKTNKFNLALLEKLLDDLKALLPAFLEGPMQIASASERDLFAPLPPTPKESGHPPTQLPQFRIALLACSTEAGTQEVLKSGLNNLEDLYSMAQAMNTQSAIGRDRLHAFVVDCIRHSTSAAEHMLTALYRKINAVRNPNPMGPIFKNNLYLIYEFCRHKAPFPALLVESLRQANRGETLSRNISECKLQGSKVQALLAKTRLFLQGNDALSPDQLLSQTYALCTEMIDVCQECYRHLEKDNKTPSDPAQVFSLFRTSFKKPPPVALNPAPFKVENPSLISIRQCLEELCKKCTSMQAKSRLQNVLNHLLHLLETEMQPSALKPSQLHLHCKSVMLKSQTIAQEVLMALCNLLLQSDVQEMELTRLQEKLGMQPKDFTAQELEFLQKGSQLPELLNAVPDFKGIRKKMATPLVRTVNDAAEYVKKQPFTSLEEDQDMLRRVKSLEKEELSALNGIITTAVRYVLQHRRRDGKGVRFATT